MLCSDGHGCARQRAEGECQVTRKSDGAVFDWNAVFGAGRRTMLLQCCSSGWTRTPQALGRACLGWWGGPAMEMRNRGSRHCWLTSRPAVAYQS